MKKGKWFLTLLFLAVIATGLYFFVLRSSNTLSIEKQIKPSTLSIPSKKKLILSWTTFFKNPLDDKYMDGCPELRQSCSLIVDRSRYAEADAIVFHPRDMNWNDLPPNRSISQRYLFLMHESPPHTCIDMDFKKNFFNWSLTYRLDSDIAYPYTYLGLDPSARQTLNVEAILKKTTTPETAPVVWLVSNCDTHSKRELYADILQKYIKIDIFGDCGKFKCPRTEEKTSSGRSKCEDMIDKKYKFYIAFENSVCTDYVTEKYYARREYNSVPIVLSRRIAEPLFPPKSFIAADDFPDGPQQMAAYLNYLTKNDTAYLEFFHWKTIGYGWIGRHPKTGLQFGFCGICEKLLRSDRDGETETKIYESANAWWGEKASCDIDLVQRLVEKDLKLYPKIADSHASPWSSKRICGY